MIEMAISRLIVLILTSALIFLLIDFFLSRKKIKELKSDMSFLEDVRRIENESKKFWHSQATQNIKTMQSLRKENEKLRLGIDADIESRNVEIEELKSRIRVLTAGEELLNAIEKDKTKQDSPQKKYGYGDLKTKVIEILIITTDQLSASELAEKLGTSPACVRKSLKSLMKTRDVERKRYGKTYKYKLTNWISADLF